MVGPRVKKPAKPGVVSKGASSDSVASEREYKLQRLKYVCQLCVSVNQPQVGRFFSQVWGAQA